MVTSRSLLSATGPYRHPGISARVSPAADAAGPSQIGRPNRLSRDERAAAVLDAAESLIARDLGDELVVVPGPLRFRWLLDLEEVEVVDLAAVRTNGPLAEQRIVGRHLFHL